MEQKWPDRYTALARYSLLRSRLAGWKATSDQAGQVDMANLQALDTAGATLLAELFGAERLLQLADSAQGLAEERRALLRTVARSLLGMPAASTPPARSTLREVLEHIGRAVEALWRHGVGLLGFIGLVLSTIAGVLARPRRWRLTSLVAHLEQTGLDAVPIIALLTFMVGAVVAFLGATVLADFGATQYTVDLVAYSFLREFGVLLTAILMAGRTASAFTAQIGIMVTREEVDAVRTLGLDPVELLVIPRLLALLVMLPLLTFIAMIAGLLGGMAVAAFELDVPPQAFITRLHDTMELRHFFVGMSKAPVFALVIGLIGCLEGLQVQGTAQSLGERTTSSVVQTISLVILFDAFAAIWFMQVGW